MPRFTENQVHHACFAAAARLVQDARVLLVCNADGGAGEALLDHGARFVHVFDPSHGAPAVPAAMRRGLVASRLPDGEIDARDGAFDAAFITVSPDEVSHRSAERVIRAVKRAVKHDGVIGVLLSGELPETDPPYLGLYDELGMHFPNVSVYGVFPWGGVAIAELGEAETDDVSIEGAQGASPRMGAYLMIASPESPELPSYSLVEIPRDEGDEDDEGSEEGDDASDDVAGEVAEEVDAATFAEVKLQAELLAAQLEEQRTRSSRDVATESMLVRRAEEAEKFLHAEKERAERLVENTRRLDEMIAEAQREMRRATDELDVEHRARKKLELEKQLLQEEVESLSAWKAPQVHVLTPISSSSSRNEDVETTVALRSDDLAKLAGHSSVSRDGAPKDDAELRGRIEAAEAKAMDLGRAFEEERARTTRYQAELDKHADSHGAEISELEAKLEERAKRFRELNRELLDKTRLAEDLVGRLAEIEAGEIGITQTSGDSQAVAGAVAESKLRAMALDLAKYEGELRARDWRIQELEDALHAREVPRDQEIADLRQALARENEARRKAETPASAAPSGRSATRSEE